MDADCYYIVRFAGRASPKELAGIREVAQKSGVQILKHYEGGNIPADMLHDSPQETNISVCDGFRLEFIGSGSDDGHDFGEYVKDMYENLIISKAYNIHKQTVWIVRAAFPMIRKGSEILRRFERDVMLGVAAVGLHSRSGGGGAGYESSWQRYDLKLTDLVAEAEKHGFCTTRVFWVHSGTPFYTQEPRKGRHLIELVDGTELVMRGPLCSEMKEIQEKKPGARVYTSLRLTA